MAQELSDFSVSVMTRTQSYQQAYKVDKSDSLLTSVLCKDPSSNPLGPHYKKYPKGPPGARSLTGQPGQKGAPSSSGFKGSRGLSGPHGPHESQVPHHLRES